MCPDDGPGAEDLVRADNDAAGYFGGEREVGIWLEGLDLVV